jgi:hypothetical protein
LLLVLAACEARKPSDAPLTPAPPLTFAELDGRWGLTEAACAHSNSAREGLIEIGPSSVSTGPFSCFVQETLDDNDGLLAITMCADGEKDFRFSRAPDGALRWNQIEIGRAEDYRRCP